MEFAVKFAKLKPPQLALLFSLALPLAAIPTLYIFLVDPALFEKLETSKLLLLAFSASAPIFSVFYGVSLVKDKIEEPKDDNNQEKCSILDSLYVASIVTAIIYGLFAMDIVLKSRVPLGSIRSAMITPVAYSAAAGYAILALTVFLARKKNRKIPIEGNLNATQLKHPLTTFRTQSKDFLRDLSRAAAWMMRESKGDTHWWRSSVLTNKNSAAGKRPIFEQTRADQIFEELIARNLLVQRADDVDGSGVPAYAMKYDINGWDKAVTDGRPLYAQWLKIRRKWLLILLTFLIGCVVTMIENRIAGVLGRAINKVVGP